MSYDPRGVANYFINRANNEQILLLNLKLQKLVVLAHGWHLGLTGEPLLTERPQAWKYGPVVPGLYRTLLHLKNGHICDEISIAGWAVTCIKENGVVQTLNATWNAYKQMSDAQLSTICHQPGTPWAQVRTRYPDRGIDIADYIFEAYYKDKIKQSPCKVRGYRHD